MSEGSVDTNEAPRVRAELSPEQEVLTLSEPAITVIRRIRSSATNLDLARNALAVGNNLDNRAREYEWERNSDSKLLRRQFKIHEGRWPVHLVNDKNKLDENFFKSIGAASVDDAILYLAKVDLRSVILGINSPYEVYASGEPATKLDLRENGSGTYSLAAEYDISKLQPDLRVKFDKNSLLLSGGLGEFFIQDFDDVRQLLDEHIYRFKGDKYQEITSEICELRPKGMTIIESERERQKYKFIIPSFLKKK